MLTVFSNIASNKSIKAGGIAGIVVAFLIILAILILIMIFFVKKKADEDEDNDKESETFYEMDTSDNFTGSNNDIDMADPPWRNTEDSRVWPNEDGIDTNELESNDFEEAYYIADQYWIKCI